MKIVHIITGLNQGGAEKALYKLITYKKDVDFVVISLGKKGIYANSFLDKGIPVIELNLKSGFFGFIKGVIKLYRLLKKENPYLVQTWMYHADLIGGIISKLAGYRVVWTIVAFNLDHKIIGIKYFLIIKICSLCSFFIPNNIIVVAKSASYTHSKFGYNDKIYEFIPIGFNLNKTKYLENSIEDNLAEIIKDRQKLNKLIIGNVGRWDPHKNHRLLIELLGQLQIKNIDFFCILVGTQMNKKNLELINIFTENKIKVKNYMLVDHVESIDNFMKNIDIFILPSLGEAFPNVLGEAMLNGVPCITTDVGDCKDIISNSGWVINSFDVIDLYNAVIKALNLKNDNSLWNAKKKLCTKIIVENYSLDSMYNKHLKLWTSYGG